MSLRRTDHSSRGVLPTVVRRCVWSRNLVKMRSHNQSVVIEFNRRRITGCISYKPSIVTNSDLSVLTVCNKTGGTIKGDVLKKSYRQKMWKQKLQRPSTTLHKMTCGISLKIGSVVCSCVSTQKRNILKANVVDFLNSLSRKSYRHKTFLVLVGPPL